MVPVAWAARVSDEEAQDPTLSLPRQLDRARTALPPGFVIVAHFFDVESGRMELDQRGQHGDYARFDISIPRDGGINDLLAEARRPDRRFVAVVCESIDRISRITRIGTTIEWELEQTGVALLAVDEGIHPDLIPGLAGAGGAGRPKKATPVLTRRVKQAISEWYVLNMLELSWEGFIQHTIQGWNIGKPPYGYLAEKIPHPVPARRAEGRTKHRLVPDPARGPVVTRIYHLRAVDRLSYDAIADQLNVDPAANPPPQPVDPARAVGTWTGSAVREILTNPKYTGHMVWNRRRNPRRGRRTGKVNPPLRVDLVTDTHPRTTHHPATVRRRRPGRPHPPRLPHRRHRQHPPADHTHLPAALLRHPRHLRPADARQDPPPRRHLLRLPTRRPPPRRQTLVPPTPQDRMGPRRRTHSRRARLLRHPRPRPRPPPPPGHPTRRPTPHRH